MSTKKTVRCKKHEEELQGERESMGEDTSPLSIFCRLAPGGLQPGGSPPTFRCIMLFLSPGQIYLLPLWQREPQNSPSLVQPYAKHKTLGAQYSEHPLSSQSKVQIPLGSYRIEAAEAVPRLLSDLCSSYLLHRYIKSVGWHKQL